MRKPWTEIDKRRKTRTIRWYTGRQVEQTLRGKKVMRWETDSFSCGRDRKLYDEKLSQITARLRNQELGQVDTGRSPAVCAAAYIADFEANGGAFASTRHMRQSIDYFLRFRPFDTMGAILKEDIADWRTDMLTPKLDENKKVIKEALRAATVKGRLTDVCSWLNWAVTNKWLSASPYTGIKKPKVKSRPRFYTDQELDDFEAKIADDFWKDPEQAQLAKMDQEEFRALARLCYLAGMRESEACTLKGEDVKRFGEEGQAVVRSIKGGEELTRTVPLCKEILDILPKQRSGFLFPRWVDEQSPGNWKASYFKVQYWFDKVAKRAGIIRTAEQGPATFYAFRHTFARIYLEQNPGRMKELCEIMGHKDYAMIMQIYGHLSPSHLRSTVSRLGMKGSAGYRLGTLEIITPNTATKDQSDSSATNGV